jgi:hypothetical protein
MELECDRDRERISTQYLEEVKGLEDVRKVILAVDLGKRPQRAVVAARWAPSVLVVLRWGAEATVDTHRTR